MFPHIVQPLMDRGAVRSNTCSLNVRLIQPSQSAVDEVIERMDEYFISREDWDTIVELGLDDHKDDLVLKKISTATKTSFTKK